MRIARVVLQNVKSYADATTIDLAPGINAVCGENGAGKSTLLEAIGFAVFGYKPYRLDAFLREGEKNGTITVTVEDDNGCSFDVVRKLGSSTGHAVYNELNQKIAEGEADVRNWFISFFGLEAGTDLAKLFEDTVGPPQGTLTAIFLESAAPRSKKFDRLLGIDDYAAAAQWLRAVTNLFRDQASDAERRAALLEGSIRRLPECEKRQRELVLRKAELATGLVRLEDERAELEAALGQWDQAQQAVQRAQAELHVAEARASEARRRWEEQSAELRRAEEAARELEASRPGYEAYLEATESLRRLNERRKERDSLRQSAEMAARNALQWEREVQAAEERLASLAKDEARAAERELLLPEQEALEKRLREAEERLRAREDAARQVTIIEERLQAADALLREAQAHLEEVEAARPVAARLEELRARERVLREDDAQLEKQEWLLKQSQNDLSEAQGRLAELQAELARLQGEVDSLRPLEQLAAQAPELQLQRDAAARDVDTILARKEEAERARMQVEGGLCPFLREPCHNLRPGVALDAHFDAVIAECRAALEEAVARRDEAESKLQRARLAEKAVARLPDLLRRIGQLSDERARLEQEIEQLKRLQSELAPVSRARLRARESLAELEPELARAEEARRIASGEPGWRRQAEEAIRAKEREERTLLELRALLEREAGAETAVEAARRALVELGDPRGEAAALRQRIGRERPEAERALEQARRESAAARAAEEAAHRSLEPYASLEEEIAAATLLRDQNENAHRSFLANQAEAARLAERRAAHQKAASELNQTALALQAARQALERANASYDEAEQRRVKQQLDQLLASIAGTRRELAICEQEEEQLRQELAELLQRKVEMEAARGEAVECRRLMDAVETVRRTLDAAGPEIARALLRRISARATSIYRDLLGQPSVSLEWGSDYEIRCRVRAEEREFKQLSGGEQMAAALAVRLALLQTISNLKLAFLDEPTAHMDTTRRANLASQIQNLRNFDQLVVISHDDSFDTLFGHVVRLAKRDGATVVEE